jgi:hypothetical protein
MPIVRGLLLAAPPGDVRLLASDVVLTFRECDIAGCEGPEPGTVAGRPVAEVALALVSDARIVAVDEGAPVRSAVASMLRPFAFAARRQGAAMVPHPRFAELEAAFVRALFERA